MAAVRQAVWTVVAAPSTSEPMAAKIPIAAIPLVANHLLGIGCMCVAVAIFAVQDAASKLSTVTYGLPVLEVVAMRFIVNVVLNVIYYGPRRVPALLRSRRPGLQLVRGGVMSLATLCNYTALQYLRLDQTVTITFLTPLLVALMAGPMLGEWVGWRRMVAIIVGFLGVLLVFRPDLGGIHWAALLSVAGALVYALYIIATRYLAPIDDAVVMQFYTPLGGLLMFGPLIFLAWETPHGWMAWAALLSGGLWGLISHWFLILAHRRAPAPVVAPFIYTEIFWMVALGAVLFGDWPDRWTLAGTTIVIASGLYLLYRETVQARQERSNPSVTA
jgi:drug/metabolite transporter (DMT)-like permease